MIEDSPVKSAMKPDCIMLHDVGIIKITFPKLIRLPIFRLGLKSKRAKKARDHHHNNNNNNKNLFPPVTLSMVLVSLNTYEITEK